MKGNSQIWTGLPRHAVSFCLDTMNDPRRFGIVLLAAIVLLSLGIRSYRLSDRSLWLDEAFTWRLIQFPIPDMAVRIAYDNSPPLYYFVLKLWAACTGTSPFAMRFLSVLFGAVTVLAMYCFASVALNPERTDGRVTTDHTRGNIAFLVALLLSLSVFQIRWAWEIRMYTLGTALMALSSWLLFRALKLEHHRAWNWLLYGFTTLLFAYTHYYALFSIAAQAIFLAGFMLARARWKIAALRRDASLPYALLAMAIVGIGWLPWLVFFLRQKAQVESSYWIAPVSLVRVACAFYQMFVDPQDAAFPVRPVLVVAVLCAAGLLLLPMRPKAGDLYVFTAAVVPFALSLGISLLGTNVFYFRYFAFAHLFFLTALAILIHRLPAWPRAMLTSIVLAFSVWIDMRFWQQLDVDHHPGSRAAAGFIAQHREPSEPVVAHPVVFLPILYYSSHRDGVYAYADGEKIPHYSGAAAITREQALTPLELRALPARRIWVVDSTTRWGSSLVQVPPSWRAKKQEIFPEVFSSQVIVVTYEVTDPVRSNAEGSAESQDP